MGLSPDELTDDPFAPPPEWAQDDGGLSDVDRARLDYEAKKAAVEMEAAEARAARQRVLRIQHTVTAAWRKWGAGAAFLTGGAMAFFLIPWGIWWLFIRTSPHEVTLLERSWQRTIEEQEYVVDDDNRSWSKPSAGWGENDKYIVPASITSRREVRSTTCMSRDKNGWCTFEIENYDDRWYWTEHRWDRNGESHVTESTTAAPGFELPHWPDPDLGPDTPEIGNRRLSPSRRWEILSVVMANDGGVFDWVAPNGDRSPWYRVEVGETVTAHVNAVGHVRGITLREEAM